MKKENPLLPKTKTCINSIRQGNPYQRKSKSKEKTEKRYLRKY